MPRADPPRPFRPSVSLTVYLNRPPRKQPRRRKGGEPEPEREPVEPPNPRPLSGGAAAALEHDD
jgi:hypothetical protein